MKLFIMSMFFFALGAFGTDSDAEGGCPPGQYPQQGQGWQTCVPIPGASPARTPQSKPEAWKNNWQAIAADMARGTLGVATGMNDKASASLAALADCRRQGGLSCETKITQRNGCLAMVVGEKTANYEGGDTLSIAEDAGMAECRSSNAKCVVYYSKCDLPVRLQ